MKKTMILKIILIAILLIIACSATAFATYRVVASNVMYNKSGEGQISVASALNQLYSTRGASSSNYSTEEQVVGTWIDGETLYQKTIVYNQLLPGNNGWADLTLDCTNMDNIVSQVAFYTLGSSQFTSDGGRGWMIITKDLNKLQVGQNQTGGANTVILVAVTIQYTKTEV